MFIVELILTNILNLASFYLLYPTYTGLFLLCLIALVVLQIRIFMRANRQVNQLRTSLESGLRSIADGDFSISLPNSKLPADNVVIELFNQTTDKLRKEKQSLYQRELLLDKVVNASDAITILINQRDTVVFANLAAQQFFNQPALIGANWRELLLEKQLSDKQNLALYQQQNHAIVQLAGDENSQEQHSWHLSKHHLKLHGASHQLVLLKPITKALQEQELQTWKKVVRVINHELNNSIAPISSMCHSGKILAEKLEQPQLDRVFNTISSRIQTLSQFIQNYSQLARLSQPKKVAFDLLGSLKQMQSLYQVNLHTEVQSLLIHADQSQIEQLFINLIKNANEVCPTQPCHISVTKQGEQIKVTVEDYGSGMPSDVMQKAFLPYYSTKDNGSGIGLSICKEVVEAHSGTIELSNRSGGGLEVTIFIPIE